MKIWELKTDPNNNGALIIPNDEEREKLLFDYIFEGKSISERWQPIKVEGFEVEEGKGNDTLSFSAGIPAVSEKAVFVLADLLKEVTEILPLDYRKEKYYAINVVQVIDCINYEKAECIRFKNSDDVMDFKKYAFKPELVKDKHIFKIPEHPRAYVLVSDEFRKCVLDSGLEGFDFEELWDSEKE